MNGNPHPGTLLSIPLLEEKYGRPLLASIGIHAGAVLFVIFAPLVLPSPNPVQIGTGPGGGVGGESYAVGIADDMGGGAGMIKPSLIPQPPALPAEKTEREENKEAVPIPDTVAPKKAIPRREDIARSNEKKPIPAPPSNVIPTTPRPGAGGTGGLGGGTGGGRGGGSGVSIGAGSGGLGDSWYARAVESRISSNWIRPPEGVRVEIVLSFLIASDGSIYDIRKEKSSGNDALDLAAERAIRTSNPLAAPPPELRGRPVQFVAQFIFPPNP